VLIIVCQHNKKTERNENRKKRKHFSVAAEGVLGRGPERF
jgi:hypothetical protein